MSKSHKSRGSSVERKVSVFERLGSKAASASKSKNVSKKGYVDGDEASVKMNKQREDQTGRSKGQEMKKILHSKKNKEKHKKPYNARAGSADSDDLDLDLEGADEKFLQKRRLQLQRELRLQLQREKTTVAKKPKKTEKKTAPTSSSGSTSESSSGSSSTSSSYGNKRNVPRKRKLSASSGSDSPQVKRKISTKPVVKPQVEIKKKPGSPRKLDTPKKIAPKKSASPGWEHRASPTKKKTPPSAKSRPSSSKSKPREPSPKRRKSSKERRVSPPVQPRSRPRSPDRRHRHSPRPRQGGLEKGGKILPVKSLAHAKELKESVRVKEALRVKTPERLRDEKEKERERIKERRRRELKVRETERREREREAERMKRETERQKERDEALARSRERQRERERIDREKRIKDYDRKEIKPRKIEIKSDLPSLLDIKTEAPREPARQGWDERRGRRADDNFEFRHPPREDLGSADDRRRPYDAKWPVEGSGRDPSWRENYTGRRPPVETTSGTSFAKQEPRSEERPIPGDHSKRPVPDEPRANDLIPGDRKAELEEALSDISDDADDILNQEDPPAEPVDTTAAQLLPAAISQPSADFFFDSRRPLLECLDADFEEISDEELEEEAKMGRGIMDVLGADWASLMSQTAVKPPETETAGLARRLWRVDTIIARIGISRKLAGDKFTDKFLSQIQVGNQATVQNSDDISAPNQTTRMEIKRETAVEKKPVPVTFLHPLPAVHAMLHSLSDPSPIARILNSNKHALSARTDLSIRRVACGFAPKESLQLTSVDDNLFEANLMVIKSAEG